MSTVEKCVKLRSGHYYLQLTFKEDDVIKQLSTSTAACHFPEKTVSTEQTISRGMSFLEVDMVDMLKELKRTLSKQNGIELPKKKRNLRVVFDCSASFQRASLNCKLIQGPNLTSNLICVRLHFQQEPVVEDFEDSFSSDHHRDNQEPL